MMYLWPLHTAMTGMSAAFGVMTAAHTPRVAEGIIEGRWWACDNEAFTGRFTPERFFGHLERLKPYRARCLFASCPDKVGDAVATLALWHEWAPRIKADGWPVAFVCQDGQTPSAIPECDAVFIGGTDAFKLSANADACIREGKRRGVWTHVGRVNGGTRFRRCLLMEVDSVDGTNPTYEPNVSRKQWIRHMAQPALFSLLFDGDHPRQPVERALRAERVNRECLRADRPGPEHA